MNVFFETSKTFSNVFAGKGFHSVPKKYFFFEIYDKPLS